MRYRIVIVVQSEAEAERVRERAMTEARHMGIWPESSEVWPDYALLSCASSAKDNAKPTRLHTHSQSSTLEAEHVAEPKPKRRRTRTRR